MFHHKEQPANMDPLLSKVQIPSHNDPIVLRANDLPNSTAAPGHGTKNVGWVEFTFHCPGSYAVFHFEDANSFLSKSFPIQSFLQVLSKNSLSTFTNFLILLHQFFPFTNNLHSFYKTKPLYSSNNNTFFLFSKKTSRACTLPSLLIGYRFATNYCPVHVHSDRSRVFCVYCSCNGYNSMCSSFNLVYLWLRV